MRLRPRGTLHLHQWLHADLVDELLVLRHEGGEERFLERVALWLQRTEAFGHDVQVLRGVRDEAPLGEPPALHASLLW